MLRVHVGRLTGRDAEERGVEFVDAVKVPAVLRVRLGGPFRIGIVVGFHVPAASRRLPDTAVTRAQGLPETGEVDANIPLDSVFPVYTTYTIQEADVKAIGTTPTKPSEQAKKKYLPYTSLLEFLTERYHCDPAFLTKINKGLNLDNLKVGDEVRVPNVEPFKIEELPKQGNLPDRPEYKHRVIQINRAEKMLELKDGEKLIASVPITPGSGSGSTQTPPGKWKILGIAAMPNFRWDEGVLNHGVRTETFHLLPPGPNNPVGVLWIGLNKPGIGIHGTNSPQTIGRSASHGCMRVANWDVIRLSKLITKGMKVVIQ
ncbi:MAG: L,D-transpeptidase [Verrucomicrobiaceae bacterium]|nr:MAG: L,D-transpeptidase [Verrucomicrobiaceae bacterium]